MQKILPKLFVQSKLTQGIISTLAFFDIYQMPLSAERVWQLLYRTQATQSEVNLELARLVQLGIVLTKQDLYALQDWDQQLYSQTQVEINKRLTKVKKYFWLLSALPFVEQISIINSVALGTAGPQSDIDFLIVTKSNRLYFVRTLVILLFRLLRVYKRKDQISMRFCFGFYVTSDSLNMKDLSLQPEDPYFVFWWGTLTPILGLRSYERMIKENKWIYSWLPNFDPIQRLGEIKQFKPASLLRSIMTALCFIPAAVFEPFLRYVHISHTFKLPENHWKTSTTIANAKILKLHALDVRKDLRHQFLAKLEKFGVLQKYF